MASFMEPNILAFKADGAMSQGMAVKAGSDREHVAKSTAATDKIVGLAFSSPTAAGETMEVCLPGGGGKGLCGGTVAFGDLLTADSGGKLVATTTANDRVVAIAMEDGVVNDLIAVNVVISNV